MALAAAMPVAVDNASKVQHSGPYYDIDIIHAGVNFQVWHLSTSRIVMINGIIAGSRSVD